MKTVHKMALARAAYRAVHFGRAIAGRTDHCVATRDGITYDLDLSQGIDFAIYFGNVFERSTKAALRRLVEPSALVLDVGANIGAHTLHLARLVGPHGRVLAFEPTDFAFQKQMRNFSLNPHLARRIVAHQCFLAAQDQAAIPDTVYSSWPLPRSSDRHAKHPKHLGQEMPTKAAHARSLDSVLSEYGDAPVQLVKLDVDGYECEILRGASALLSAVKPIFVMELAPYVLDERGSSLKELLSFFTPNGYRFFDEATDQPLSSSAADLQNMIADGESKNVIARSA
jgi:FkbM family methyltransferase